jgi:hypothetical protein
MAGLLG